MATVYSGWVATDDWRIKLDYSMTYPHGNTAQITCTASIQNQYANAKSGATVTVTVNGSSWSQTISPISGSGVKAGTAHSWTLSRGTSAQAVSISARATMPGSSLAVYRNGTSVSTSVTMAATDHHTFTYNGNGGTVNGGASTWSNTKWYGSHYYIPTLTMARSGYGFLGWAESASATSPTKYPGNEVTRDQTITFYAVWKRERVPPTVASLSVNRTSGGGTATTTVHNLLTGTKDWTGDWYTYNDGTGNNTATDGGTVDGFSARTVATAWNGITRRVQLKSGVTYTFSSYVKVDAGNVAHIYISDKVDDSYSYAEIDAGHKEFGPYSDGAWHLVSFTFTPTSSDSSKTLKYAVPRVVPNGNYNLSVYGYMLCEGTSTTWEPAASEDTSSDTGGEGTSAEVSVSWAVDTAMDASNAVGSVTAAWLEHGGTGTASTATLEASGTSGTSSATIGDGKLDATKSYDVTVTVTDTAGATTNATTLLPPVSYTLDFAKGGRGIGVFQPAPDTGVAVAGDVTATSFNGLVCGKTLWSGSLAKNGTITVPEIQKYHLFGFYFAPAGLMNLGAAWRGETNSGATTCVYVFGGWDSGNSSNVAVGMFPVSGTTLTFKAASGHELGNTSIAHTAATALKLIVGYA